MASERKTFQEIDFETWAGRDPSVGLTEEQAAENLRRANAKWAATRPLRERFRATEWPDDHHGKWVVLWDNYSVTCDTFPDAHIIKKELTAPAIVARVGHTRFLDEPFDEPLDESRLDDLAQEAVAAVPAVEDVFERHLLEKKKEFVHAMVDFVQMLKKRKRDFDFIPIPDVICDCDKELEDLRDKLYLALENKEWVLKDDKRHQTRYVGLYASSELEVVEMVKKKRRRRE